jgi:hypothetical protein
MRTQKISLLVAIAAAIASTAQALILDDFTTDTSGNYTIGIKYKPSSGTVGFGTGFNSGYFIPSMNSQYVEPYFFPNGYTLNAGDQISLQLYLTSASLSGFSIGFGLATDKLDNFAGDPNKADVMIQYPTSALNNFKLSLSGGNVTYSAGNGTISSWNPTGQGPVTVTLTRGTGPSANTYTFGFTDPDPLFPTQSGTFTYKSANTTVYFGMEVYLGAPTAFPTGVKMDNLTYAPG